MSLMISYALTSSVEEYDLLVANGAYIHFVHFEGEDAVTLSSDLFERVSGIDFLYKYDKMRHVHLYKSTYMLARL